MKPWLFGIKKKKFKVSNLNLAEIVDNFWLWLGLFWIFILLFMFDDANDSPIQDFFELKSKQLIEWIHGEKQ